MLMFLVMLPMQLLLKQVNNMPLTPSPFEKSIEATRNSKEYIAKLGKTAVWLGAIMVGSAYAIGGQAVELVKDAADAYIKHEYEDPEE